MSSHYDVLGVEPDATAEQIRAAYVAAARRHHPDRAVASPDDQRSGVQRRMQDINAAWAVVGDPEARSAYDRELRSGSGGPGRSGGSSSGRVDPDVPERSFTPYFEHDEDDDDAWRYEPDPLNPDATPPRLIIALPPVLAALGVVLVVISIPLGMRPVLAAGVICLALGALGFIGAPLFAMLQGQQAEQRAGRRRDRR